MRSASSFLIAAASTRAVPNASEPPSAGSVIKIARSAPIASARRNPSCALAGPMLTAVSSLLPTVSLNLIAAEIVLSSPGSSTSETPVRTRRFVFGSILLTTVLGSGICFTQTNIFIALLPRLCICGTQNKPGQVWPHHYVSPLTRGYHTQWSGHTVPRLRPLRSPGSNFLDSYYCNCLEKEVST